MQYWGGPTTYSDRRGHPRLRMRHAPFAVTPLAKEHWLTHFRAGLDEAGLPPELDAQFWDYVTHAAQFMVNTFDEPVSQPSPPAPSPAAHARASDSRRDRPVSWSNATSTTSAVE